MPAFQGERPVRAAREIHIVGDVKRGQLPGPMQILEQIHDHLAGPEVEIARGFVGEKNAGVAHQRARQYDALLLSTRKLTRAMLCAVSQAHFIQPLQSDWFCVFSVQTPNQQRHHHVLHGRKLGQKRLNLPDKSQFPVAELRQFVRRKSAYVVLPEVYRTVRWRVQTSQQVEQRALAGARLADQGHLLAFGYLQIQARENHQLGLARSIHLRQVHGLECDRHPAFILQRRNSGSARLGEDFAKGEYHRGVLSG
jgi:hypothetical protein